LGVGPEPEELMTPADPKTYGDEAARDLRRSCGTRGSTRSSGRAVPPRRGAGRVLALVLGRTLALLAAGAIAGGLLAWLAGGLLASVVYGASLADPLVLGGIAAALVTAGVVSCWGPARRAIGVSPVTALRSE
jgi:hypothetical protein